MSRIGKEAIIIPEGTEFSLQDGVAQASCKGVSLAYKIPPEVEVKMEDNKVMVAPKTMSRHARALWGTVRARIANIVKGVGEGFNLSIVVEGVGYRAQVKGSQLVVQAGYSHEIALDVPEGITAKCPQPTEIELHGHDKQRLGQFGALICQIRKPEPYKGKGIRLKDRVILRKEGKKK